MRRIESEALLTPRDAAKWLGISEKWLERMRQVGDGPIFCRIGQRRIMYSLAALQAYVERRSVRSTSEV